MSASALLLHLGELLCRMIPAKTAPLSEIMLGSILTRWSLGALCGLLDGFDQR